MKSSSNLNIFYLESIPYIFSFWYILWFYSFNNSLCTGDSFKLKDLSAGHRKQHKLLFIQNFIFHAFEAAHTVPKLKKKRIHAKSNQTALIDRKCLAYVIWLCHHCGTINDINEACTAGKWQYKHKAILLNHIYVTFAQCQGRVNGMARPVTSEI